MTGIYLITVIQKIENTSDNLHEFGDIRCVGYFESKEEADNAVVNNWCNIHDNMYQYAIIEYIEPGILLQDLHRYFYEWNEEKKQYEPKNEPKSIKGYCNFSIG